MTGFTLCGSAVSFDSCVAGLYPLWKERAWWLHDHFTFPRMPLTLRNRAERCLFPLSRPIPTARTRTAPPARTTAWRCRGLQRPRLRPQPGPPRAGRQQLRPRSRRSPPPAGRRQVPAASAAPGAPPAEPCTGGTPPPSRPSASRQGPGPLDVAAPYPTQVRGGYLRYRLPGRSPGACRWSNSPAVGSVSGRRSRRRWSAGGLALFCGRHSALGRLVAVGTWENKPDGNVRHVSDLFAAHWNSFHRTVGPSPKFFQKKVAWRWDS